MYYNAADITNWWFVMKKLTSLKFVALLSSALMACSALGEASISTYVYNSSKYPTTMYIAVGLGNAAPPGSRSKLSVRLMGCEGGVTNTTHPREAIRCEMVPNGVVKVAVSGPPGVLKDVSITASPKE